MIPAPRWSAQELEVARLRAIELFRQERLQEPLEAYLQAFENCQGAFEDLLETTIDLTQLDAKALEVLTDPRLLEVFRYLPGPPVSRDDLETLSEAKLKPAALGRDPEMVHRVIGVVREGLDRRRFAWIGEQREPTPAERDAAVLASAALIATSRTQTMRRNEGAKRQEGFLKEALLALGLTKVPARRIPALAAAPRAGEFCGESRLGKGKADVVVGLWDGRILAIECKVSNSAVNSIKRLNREAAAKAEAWIADFGQVQVVPAALLSGVFDRGALENAQARDLTLFWAHQLESLTQWIESTRSA